MADDKTKENKPRAKLRNDSTPTAEGDREQLDASTKAARDRGGRKARADVDINPPEVLKNHADWSEGRKPNDVVEVEGQRETVEARMARNGVYAPEKQAGATTSD